MKQLFTLLSVILLTGAYNCNAQIFWTENFESGSTAGEVVTAYTGPNGTWTQSIGSTEGDVPNLWYVSCAENGHTTGVCGTGCVAVSTTATGATLHIGSNPASLGGADPGASYDAGGLCGLIYCVNTDKRAISPTINCTGKYTITMSFYYIEDGDGTNDDGSVWYSPDNGVTWSLLVNTPKTITICPGGQGYWTHYSIALPASANNNPLVKIGFNWINNDDGVGTDPSFAVDSVSLSVPVSSTPTASYSVTPSLTTCQDSCITFTNTSTGSVDSFKWSAPGITLTTTTVSPVSICFSVAGTYAVTLTDYHGGTPYPVSHTVTVNPTPHPVIHYGPAHTLSVTGTGYTSYQWAVGSPIPTPITGATNSSYTTTTPGTYYVGVDSAGCTGYSPVPFLFTTLGIAGMDMQDNTYWFTPNGSSGKITLHAALPLEGDLAISLYDATGRVAVKDTWLQNTGIKEMDAANLPSGLYIIKLSNAYTSTVLKWLK